jgi:type I restriction enzyme M protein
VGYGDYLEQLTYLLFLKIGRRVQPTALQPQTPNPPEFNWESLKEKSGADLEAHYYKTAARTRALPKAYTARSSQERLRSRIRPSLVKLFDMIDWEQWSSMGADVQWPNL